jgi:hypothetical protein
MPNIGLRFDYSSSYHNASPFSSLYYTNFVDYHPAGTALASLIQSARLARKDGDVFFSNT